MCTAFAWFSNKVDSIMILEGAVVAVAQVAGSQRNRPRGGGEEEGKVGATMARRDPR